MTHPKVSVIVPNYNHASFLEQRLQSVFNQTYTNIEVILLDDASSDNSLSILNKYKTYPQTTCLLTNNTNSGSPFHQWFKGLDYAVGKYVWIAESDDWANTFFLEKTVAILEQNPNLGISYTHSYEIDTTNEILGERKYLSLPTSSTIWQTDFKMEGTKFIKEYLLKSNVIPNTSAVVFRKKLVKLVDCRVFDMKKAGDWLFWCSMLMKSDVSFIAQPLNHFRTHDKNVRKYKNINNRKVRLREEAEIIRYVYTQIFISQEEIGKVWQSLSRRWKRIYLKNSLIDKELFIPPFQETNKLLYYIDFFSLEKKFYNIPYIFIIILRLIYSNVKRVHSKCV